MNDIELNLGVASALELGNRIIQEILGEDVLSEETERRLLVAFNHELQEQCHAQ